MSELPASNLSVSEALQWLETGWAANDNRREAAKVAAVVNAQAAEIERLTKIANSAVAGRHAFRQMHIRSRYALTRAVEWAGPMAEAPADSRPAWFDIAREALSGMAPVETSGCTIGVGDGSGNLFVHGSYDAVKRVQSMILELTRLTEALRNVRDHGCNECMECAVAINRLLGSPAEPFGNENLGPEAPGGVGVVDLAARSPDQLCKRCRHSYRQHTKGSVAADYCRHCVCPAFVPYSREKATASPSDTFNVPGDGCDLSFYRADK